MINNYITLTREQAANLLDLLEDYKHSIISENDRNPGQRDDDQLRRIFAFELLLET